MKNLKVSGKYFKKFTGGSTTLPFLPNLFLNACENEVEPNRRADPNFTPDIEIELTAHESSVPILSGNKTNVWKYSGSVIKGRKDSLQILDDNYLGPIFRVKKVKR